MKLPNPLLSEEQVDKLLMLDKESLEDKQKAWDETFEETSEEENYDFWDKICNDLELNTKDLIGISNTLQRMIKEKEDA